MFRNPRSNAIKPEFAPTPSVGRPPSPPLTPLRPNVVTNGNMSVQTASLQRSASNISASARSSVPPLKGSKPKQQGNSSILSFFKKAEPGEPKNTNGALFIDDGAAQEQIPAPLVEEKVEGNAFDEWIEAEHVADRYNESTGPVKRRKTSNASIENPNTIEIDTAVTGLAFTSIIKEHVGPFVDESDSEDEMPNQAIKDKSDVQLHDEENTRVTSDEANLVQNDTEGHESDPHVPPLKREATSMPDQDGFDGFEGMADFEDEYEEGEEYVERQWMRKQQRLEEAGDFEGDEAFEGAADFEGAGDFEGAFEGGLAENDLAQVKQEFEEEDKSQFQDLATEAGTSSCPICSASLGGISENEASVHVNACIDGNPTPLPTPTCPPTSTQDSLKKEPQTSVSTFRRSFRPAKPGQENPFQPVATNGTSSAFSKLMSGHAEDAAWASAAAAENAARGKPAFQRTCPFYKIIPGFNICVDAFRYGAVAGCRAYFLSHFHSDHYIGLTSTWTHGPIYCSRPTANLVKQQLRVDPAYVVELAFEERFLIPGTPGVAVIMIPANHCPGSSLYLFEKTLGTNPNPKIQRILHCGDFRACPSHVEHPLLAPSVRDAISGKARQQKIDVCYLDTTYLNPKYAFPSQEDVIQACADMCVSLNKTSPDSDDGWERMKAARAGSAMTKFVTKAADAPPTTSQRGRLLVVVGTYSIGKERICLGIARALNSLIYAPPAKQRICAALEDAELNARLTRDPRAAQVHMTPLFEIRAETLGDYLTPFADRFSRVVGFRPSGWNYRAPGSRFTESPSVSAVLHSESWKSGFGMKALVPQRGSSGRAACFGVPYSEHSSFRELTMFCCALRIERIIPTVNIGSAKSREKMKVWCERWAVERKKNGLFKVGDHPDRIKGISADGEKLTGNVGTWYPGKGTWELRTTL